MQPGSNLKEDVNAYEENEKVLQDDRRTSCLCHRKIAAEVRARFSALQRNSTPSPHAKEAREREERTRRQRVQLES